MGERISIEKAARYLLDHDNYVIISHANPDGDTLGCAFGLRLALNSIGKHAKNICADKISDRYDYMKKAVNDEDFEPETYVTVDVADRNLLGEFDRLYGDRIDLAIDHHISHVDFAPLICVEPHAAACAQTIFKIIKEMGAELNADIAACLYTGIATDSGCFKYSSVSPETHLIAAELLRYDFPFAHINYIFFDLKTRARIALEEKILKSMEFCFDDRCAIVTVTNADLGSIDPEDANGIAVIPKQIEGVEIGIVMKEKKNGWKASLRSNESADVQEICSRLGGGGHARAAGCSFYDMGVDEAKKILLSEIDKYFKENGQAGK